MRTAPRGLSCHVPTATKRQRRLRRTREIQADRRAWRDESPCWCGEPHPLYMDDGLDRRCRGSGVLNCFCGGDFCVCHNHGEVECWGCADCDGDEGCGEDWDDLDDDVEDCA